MEKTSIFIARKWVTLSSGGSEQRTRRSTKSSKNSRLSASEFHLSKAIGISCKHLKRGNLLGNNPLAHHKEIDSPIRKIAQAPSAFVPPSRDNDSAIVGVRKGSIYWCGVVYGTQGVDIIKATRGVKHLPNP